MQKSNTMHSLVGKWAEQKQKNTRRERRSFQLSLLKVIVTVTLTSYFFKW